MSLASEQTRLVDQLSKALIDHEVTKALVVELTNRLDYLLRNAISEAKWPLVGQETIDLISRARRHLQ